MSFTGPFHTTVAPVGQVCILEAQTPELIKIDFKHGWPHPQTLSNSDNFRRHFQGLDADISSKSVRRQKYAPKDICILVDLARPKNRDAWKRESNTFKYHENVRLMMCPCHKKSAFNTYGQ